MRVLGAIAAIAIIAIIGDFDPRSCPGSSPTSLLVGVAEQFRRRWPELTGRFVSLTLLVDGVALALAVGATGGYRSPLLFLVFLDVVAVTLLVSYRSGLKFACGARC